MKKSTALRSLFIIGALLTMVAAHAQNLTVTAANASNDAIYTVTFVGSGGSINILNTDAGSLHNIVSLGVTTNPSTLQVDLIAVDNGGLIVRYPGDFHFGPESGTPIFTAGGTGPVNPDGLSIDPAGNLYVVNSKPGNASNPQVWVLPADGHGGYTTPVQIDAKFPAGENLQETLLVTADLTPSGFNQPVVKAGDLLVLTSNPSAVLRYAGSGGGNGPIQATKPTTLLNLPAGTIPGGLAFWPPDSTSPNSTLLITTSRGTIYRFQLTSVNELGAIFADGLGNGQFKVKTGTQSGAPYAVVANNNGGDILQFNGPGAPIATVTTGVQHPQGLVLSNSNFASITTCQDQQTNGCDLLGGRLVKHNIPSGLSLNGNIVEDVCMVAVDPRLANGGSCTTSLPVVQVCGGYGTNVVIPASLCGSSGPSGKGFALVKALTQAYSTPGAFNGSSIFTDSNFPNVPSGNCNPPPPLSTLAWAPLNAQEGTVVEGNNMLDITSGCDQGTGISRGLSLFGVGLALNPGQAGLTGVTTDRYTQVLATIQAQVNENPTVLPNAPFNQGLQQCIKTSKNAFAKGAAYYSGAALEALAADAQIAAHAVLPAYFVPDSDYPNPSGELRSRLQNIYYDINTRIQGNPSGSTPPTSPSPPPPPIIGGTPAPFAPSGSVYTFQPTASDFAGNTGTLSFSIVNLPSFMTFSTTTGLLTGKVKGNLKGTTFSGIVITVSDGCATAALGPFSITVD